MSDDIRLSKSDLTRFAAAIFTAAGVAPEMAAHWAEAVVWANLRGVDSHGVIRIPRYVDLLRKKSINPHPVMRLERSAGAIAVLDADRAPGAIGMARAMDEAIARARDVHVGWCAAKNITHAGAIGYFVLAAARAGMAGIAMTASGPLMAYHGARVAGVSTNPIAIAVPGKKRRPLVLDMSTSTVANGKVMAARDRGEPVPVGWGLDAEGRDTTDPKRIATLTPLGGPKGSGLSLMIECLASLAVGSPLISLALAGGLAGRPRGDRRSRHLHDGSRPPRRRHHGPAARGRRRAHPAAGRARRRDPGRTRGGGHSGGGGDVEAAGRGRAGAGGRGAVGRQ
jgi:ureidoglycolate dehydrogenase (NAD+)